MSLETWKKGVVPKGFYEVYEGDVGNLNDLKESLSWFHPEEVYMHEEDDSRAYGLRANHFVVIGGWSEAHGESRCVLVIANHKGTLMFKYFIEGAEGRFAFVSDKQRYAIEKIEGNLGVKFESNSPSEARDFIGKYINKSMNKK